MKKLAAFLLVILLITSSVFADTTKQLIQNVVVPDVKAESYILMSAKDGYVVCEKDADRRMYPASTTKILTAIIAIENGGFDKKVKISSTAIKNIGKGGSNVNLKIGEQVKLFDLLHMMLIRSGNDAGNAIAEYIAGKQNNFAALMNKRAKELGATSTTFYNAIGLDIGDGFPEHKTTARDMAIITKYAMTLPVYADIVSKPVYKTSPTNLMPSRSLESTNRFFSKVPYSKDTYIITGAKTGNTKAAKSNLVVTAKNMSGDELICVLFKSSCSEAVFNDAKLMFDYGFKALEAHKQEIAEQQKKEAIVNSAESKEQPISVEVPMEVPVEVPLDIIPTDVQLEQVLPYQ